MASADALVLDVGHGNCAIIRDDALITLIDTARGNIVVRALQRLDIAAIDRIVISHADNDHVGGLLTLLLDRRIHIRDIYVNSDAEKGRAWRMLRSALADARRRDPQVQVHVGLTMGMNFQSPTSRIEVLAPSPEVAMGGVGYRSPRTPYHGEQHVGSTPPAHRERARGTILRGY
jgi:beta-lactamase superfamily II metal-dependent hydrolase